MVLKGSYRKSSASCFSAFSVLLVRLAIFNPFSYVYSAIFVA